MKYKYLLTLLCCSLFTLNQALAQTTETTAKFHDGVYPAFTAEYPFQPDIVLQAIQQRLKKDRIAVHSRKNVLSSEGVQYDILTPQTIDLYFQVEQSGKKKDKASTVNLFISKGKDNFTGSSQDPELAQHAILYLNNLKQDITVYNLQVQLKQQQKTVDREVKNYNNLLRDAKKLEDKRYSLQQDLSKETDPAKQDKLRKRIENYSNDIKGKQSAISNAQSGLQQEKDQLNTLQSQLSAETKTN